ncbi:hypothetical protein Tco_1286659, partial [Tanacetum coccineum]
EDFSDSNVDSTSTDSFSSNDVEYVEASPPNSEPVSSKVMEIVIPEVGRIEDDILLIKDDTLREKLLNVNRLVAKTGLRPLNTARPGHSQKEDQGYVDSGCSRRMTRNMSYLLDFKEFDRGYVTFGGGAKGGRITDK